MTSLESATDSVKRLSVSFQDSEQETQELLSAVLPMLDALRSIAQVHASTASDILVAIERFTEFVQIVDNMVEFRTSIESISSGLIEADINHEFIDETQKLVTILSDSQPFAEMYHALEGFDTTQEDLDTAMKPILELLTLLTSAREKLHLMLAPSEH